MYYNCRHSSSVLVTNQHNMYSGNSEFHSVWCTEKVKLNATFVGAMWPPRFAEASLGREPAIHRKWKIFGLVYFLNLLWYSLFLISLTVFALLIPSPLQPTCKCASDPN